MWRRKVDYLDIAMENADAVYEHKRGILWDAIFIKTREGSKARLKAILAYEEAYGHNTSPIHQPLVSRRKY